LSLDVASILNKTFNDFEKELFVTADERTLNIL
jgi:hypothetical protein